MVNRRELLQAGVAGMVSVALGRAMAKDQDLPRAWFPISLAQWSLHRALRSGALDAMDFARIAKRDYGIGAIEYVNSFYQQNFSETLIKELKTRSEGEGVRNVLIMCDKEGKLGDPDSALRAQAVLNHHKWVDAAEVLGCHSIRVNAYSAGSFDEQMKLAADGLRALTEYGARQDINVIVENHGGYSSNGQWLAGVMKRVDHPRCGTLPDFGNFRDAGQASDPYRGDEVYDRYLGVTEMMPFAKGVSAKSLDFDAAGNETTIDYPRMLEIVRAAGYRGHIGIEYDGPKMPEPDAIRATHALLKRLGGGDAHLFSVSPATPEKSRLRL